MKNNEPKEIIQWSYDYIQSFYLNNNGLTSDAERQYLNYLSPFSDKYFSHLNPFILFGGAAHEQLLKKNVWMLRDGLIPLSYFFQEASVDLMKGKRKFIIHKDYWFLVPKEWQKNVIFYDITSNHVFDSNNLPKKIVITGVANETLADPEEFTEDIKELAAVFSKKDLEKIEISAYLPNKRTDLWGRWQDENIFKYAKVMFQNLKLDIDFPEWEIIKMNMDFQNTLYFEINRGTLVKDSYLQHMMLSRGAGLLKKKNDLKGFTLIKKHPLSLYHGVDIYEFDFANAPDYENPIESDIMPYFKTIIEKGTSARHVSAGWEKWYGTYVKKYYKTAGLV